MKTPIPVEGDFVRGAEVIAAALGVCRPVARRMLANGELPGARKVGGAWMISRAALIRAIDGGAAYAQAKANGSLQRIKIEAQPGHFVVFEGCAIGPIMTEAAGLELMGDVPLVKTADGSFVPASWANV
jgi:hypothetical protein